MQKLLSRCFFSLLFFCLMASHVFAQDPVKDQLNKNNPKAKDICVAVKKTIKDGLNTKDVVKTGIQLGHSACLIIKCAINAEGNLKEVVTGAIEAGTPTEVVARCATDAGADAKEVAQYISLAGVPGLCYIEPEKLDPLEIRVPGEQHGGGFVSPSSPATF
jgi:hypothetical protein